MVEPTMSAGEAIEANLVACWPERGFAGFSRIDSTLLFYSYVNALVTPASVVLDLGAGRGMQGETDFPYKRALLTLRGRVAKVIGVDFDPIVFENPLLDEAAILAPDGRLPFGPETFDLVYSDWVMEHVEKPARFVAEVDRVLKPGGWFCGRTPNKYGFIAMGSRMVPESLHGPVLKVLRPDRRDMDVFPTFYRLNTLGAVAKHFPVEKWRNCSFTHDSEMMYFARSRLLLRLSAFMSRLTPQAMRPILYAFVQKRAASA